MRLASFWDPTSCTEYEALTDEPYPLPLEKLKMAKKKMMKLRPTRNLVLCRASEKDSRVSPGGIHIPDTVRGRGDRAEVLAVGEGWWTAKGILIPCCCEPGQVILFNPYSVVWAEGVSMDVQTKHASPGGLFLIHDSDILAVEV